MRIADRSILRHPYQLAAKGRWIRGMLTVALGLALGAYVLGLLVADLPSDWFVLLVLASILPFIVHNEYISHDKRTELFQRASIVALPYIDASQSGVIPVAYTHAKPVVATAVGSLPEMVDHGRTGYVVPPRDEQALADAIVRLLRDKDLRRQLGANGKHKVNTECSPGVVAEQTLAVYQRAIDSGRPRGHDDKKHLWQASKES